MIQFPDVSSYQAGLTILPGTAVVIAKATEGTTYSDSAFPVFKQQSAAVGAVFSGYHFLHGGNDSGQAAYCHNVVGSVPVMVDVEAYGATFADCLGFIDAMHALGGRVWGAYIPEWYWAQIGKPDLTPLIIRGVVLISSNYSSLSGGAGNQPYGGMTPAVWQYTDAASYSGQSIDMNAFEGTTAELAALILGEDDMDMSTKVTFPANLSQVYPELKQQFMGPGQTADLNTLLTWLAGRVAHMAAVLDGVKADVDVLKTKV